MPGRDIFMKTAQENVMHSNIRQMKVYCHNRRITRHGFPTATQFSGMERVTTLPAPMTLFLPIVTPGRRIAPPPIQTPSSIVTGLANVRKKVVPFSLRLTVPGVIRDDWRYRFVHWMQSTPDSRYKSDDYLQTYSLC